jgi:hypothetical protein
LFLFFLFTKQWRVLWLTGWESFRNLLL